MIPQFIIYVETLSGELIKSFTWCRDLYSGIVFAEQNIAHFSISDVKIWADPLELSNV